MPQPLARIVDQLKREPSRTGSLVITAFGEAIVPRGGSVWLGTLLTFFEALDIDSGVVRTAMSRLAADGWLARSKVGRNSFYRLAEKGRETFVTAMRHVYHPHTPDWTGRFELLLIGNGDDREASREALKAAGFGSPVPGMGVSSFYQAALARGARVLVDSQYAADLIAKRHGLSFDRMVVMPRSVDTARFDPPAVNGIDRVQREHRQDANDAG